MVACFWVGGGRLGQAVLVSGPVVGALGVWGRAGSAGGVLLGAVVAVSGVGGCGEQCWGAGVVVRQACGGASCGAHDAYRCVPELPAEPFGCWVCERAGEAQGLEPADQCEADDAQGEVFLTLRDRSPVFSSRIGGRAVVVVWSW